MSNIKNYILAARPKTLPASIGPVILATSIAFYNGAQINLSILVVTLLCALMLQIASNYINDYYDYKSGIDNAKRLGPKRVTASGLIAPKDVKKAFIICLFLAFILGLYLMYIGGLPIVIIGLSSIIFAYLYTGGPLPLSHIYLGEVLAFIFFGPVAVLGAYFLQTNSHDQTALMAGISLGFISAALMSINNLRDIHTDKLTTKKTLAIFLGENKARVFTIILIIFSLALPIFMLNENKLFLIVFITPFFFFKSWRAILTNKIDQDFNNHLANCGKYLLIFSLTNTVVFLYEAINR